MSLTPDEISEVISSFSQSQRLEYILVGFQTFFLYYWPTTVATEVNLIWPRRWRWGKALFLINRYFPMMDHVANILTSFRVYIVLAPKACTFIYGTFQLALLVVYSCSAELTLLLCFHALLGARSMYLAPIMATYLALTLGVHVMQIGLYAEASRTLPLSEVDRELGYACTWAGKISTASQNKRIIAGYISLAKALCIFALVLFIFLVRYRSQAGTFKLFHVLRRDSGVCILLLTAIRLSGALLGAFQPRFIWYDIPAIILDGLNRSVVPVLANRLLLNMWRTQDPEVRKTVSSLLFDPPRPGEDSDDDDEEFGDRPVELVRYEGLGRRRAPTREANERVPQRGAGAKLAVENGDGV
ncbi:hypothetical protein DFP72DRAFT_1045352 [Ephemerocybe angulata]|uniref:DUF6533 domain-containing protein n=1 Tax=Ephemerocybe angulata TaxID=980116 RepID=A0A8H6I072_9AGAR|nr:hypothetical protein DFP72DRAFT_1045352 [Tulosesus angulatus]